MITSEKELEDYICDNQEEFMECLKNELNIDTDLFFVGRQVKIGNDNICDLLYSYSYNEGSADFIIVELKFRVLEVRDLSQISRYMSVLRDKIELDKKEEYLSIKGVFVSFGISHELQEISCARILDDIYFLQIKSKLEYQRESYSKNEDYIKRIELDERIEKAYESK